MVHLRFDSEYLCELIEKDRSRRFTLQEPDWDEAVRDIAHLNQTLDDQGRPFAGVEWNGMRLWWGGQDYLLRALLIPIRRYRPVLEALRETGATVHLEGAPKDFVLYALPVLRRLGIRCVPDPSASWSHRLGRFLDMVPKLLLALASLVWCWIRRPQVLLYVTKPIDAALRCDRRHKEIYATLREVRVRFLEVVFAERGRSAWGDLLERRRLSLHFRQIARLVRWLPLPRTRPRSAEEPDAVMSALLDEHWDYLAGQAWTACILSPIFRLTGARTLLLHDDVRQMYPLIAAARRAGMRVVMYQHGMFTRYQIGLYGLGVEEVPAWVGPDIHFVWSEAMRRRLLERSSLFDEDHLRVSGHIREVARVATRAPRPGSVLRLLWVGETLSRVSEIKPFLEPLIGRPERFRIRYRPRPDNIDSKQMSEMRTWGWPIEVSERTTLSEDLEGADVLLGTYSTTVYESYLSLVPSVVMDVKNRWVRSTVEEGWTMVAESPAAIIMTIERAAALDVDQVKGVRDRIWGSVTLGARAIVEACLNP